MQKDEKREWDDSTLMMAKTAMSTILKRALRRWT
jgi:hypothetical protein